MQLKDRVNVDHVRNGVGIVTKLNSCIARFATLSLSTLRVDKYGNNFKR